MPGFERIERCLNVFQQTRQHFLDSPRGLAPVEVAVKQDERTHDVQPQKLHTRRRPDAPLEVLLPGKICRGAVFDEGDLPLAVVVAYQSSQGAAQNDHVPQGVLIRPAARVLDEDLL
jgi:hypothetical protein